MAIDIRKSLKRFAPHFIEAREKKLKEADTVLRLVKFFEEVLGYNCLQDISREAEMKQKYVDICLKVDGVIRLLVEIKAADQKLRERHIEQAQSYASRNNYRWVLLTNGIDWQLYHLTFEEGIEYERAFDVSLDTPEAIEKAADKLALLHKLAVKKGELEQYWEKTSALSPVSISDALFSNEVLLLLRREIRKNVGLLIDTEDLAKSLHDMFSTETRELIGPPRVRKPRRVKKAVHSETSSPASTHKPIENDEQQTVDVKVESEL